jgi:glycosyltransferase involved in cell wall biosynthesis
MPTPSREGRRLRRSVFLVWGRPDQGPRSQALARELGIETTLFIAAPGRRGRLWAIPRYGVQAFRTIAGLVRLRPRVVFVQVPPSFVAWIAAAYGRATGAAYVLDAHSAAFQVGAWMRPRRVFRWVTRGAVATTTTDEHWAALVRAAGGRAFVIPDVPTDFPTGEPYPRSDRFRVVVVNTWAPDEPIGAVLEAARQVTDIEFVITGSVRRATVDVGAAPANVIFSDFLPEPRYHALLAGADAVMCLTTRDHTMQRGACEALSHGRPIVTSDWPLLRAYFRKGAVLVDPSPDGIRDGIARLRLAYQVYLREVLELRDEEREMFRSRRDILITAVMARLKGSAE